jgi:c-di-GMP-binding flagellar brake protein YcgR
MANAGLAGDAFARLHPSKLKPDPGHQDMSDTEVQTPPESDTISFDTLQLQVGTRLQLGVTRDVRQIQLFSSVIGWLKNEYLLLQMPLDGTQAFPLREGDRLTVRVFSGVRVCWFHTTVLRTMHPYLYMHVSFPREISGRQLRTALRVRVNIPARVSVPGAASAIAATLRNVSISGAALDTPEAIPESTDMFDLRFTLEMPAGLPPMPIETKAVVRSRTSSVVNDPVNPYLYTYGVQFTGLDATHKLALQNLIYETLIADRQKLV